MLTKTGLARFIAQHAKRELYDDSGVAPTGVAIYSLVDPRELKVSRYIGQTAVPRRRFMQHLRMARLWMPQVKPWWVPEPKLRPLYEWLRELYSQENRLPTMIIHSWSADTRQARVAERTRICEALANQLPLFNLEGELLKQQLPLI
jgi:hypothetical protein